MDKDNLYNHLNNQKNSKERLSESVLRIPRLSKTNSSKEFPTNNRRSSHKKIPSYTNSTQQQSRHQSVILNQQPY
jgi:hypothetical protein